MNNRAWFVWSATLAYATLIVVWSCFHVPWRDEVLPVTLVRQSHSLWDLFNNLRNYGHPAVWSSILYFVYHIFPHYSVLKIVNVLINILAIHIFLRKAPFSWTQKILFLFGYFTFYYFPVINRQYGLCLLLFILFCILYPQRWQKILPLSIVLFLLSNTHVEGLIITIAVWLILVAELLIPGKSGVLKENSFGKILSGLIIMLAGMVVSIWQVHTDSSSVVFSLSSLDFQKVLSALPQAIIFPGKIFRHVLGGEHALRVNLVIIGTYFLLRKHPASLGVMILSAIGLSLFFQLVFPGYDLYHESFIYMLMIFAFWMTMRMPQEPMPGLPGKIQIFESYFRNAALTGILLLQAMMAYPALKAEMQSDFSSSKSFSQWIKAQPGGNDFVLMGEPDYLLESMPYYVPNDIYMAREQRFSRMTLLTVKNQKILSLEDFIQAAERLKTQGKNILLVMGHHLNRTGPFEIQFSYGKIFKYSPESLNLWEEKTRKVVGFHGALTDENYDVFVLR